MERAELARLLRASLDRSGTGQTSVRPGGPSGKAAIVSEPDPAAFMRTLTAAAEGEGPVFLADPAWGQQELSEFQRLTQSALRNPHSAIEEAWLCIPTGGTTGGIRLARHDASTISAAVAGFARHFSIETVSAIGVLPLHHVGGLMAWMRCALTGGVYCPWSWKELEAGRLPELPAGECFLSLVPTQLKRLLANERAAEWLKRFRAVFVGAGPLDEALADEAGSLRLPLSPSYGMTETAAMVTALEPKAFLAGGRSCGRALPHAKIEMGPGGTITIEGESLFRGYWPEVRKRGPFSTGDLGSLDSQGRLRVSGRASRVILTGGRKVDATELEAALMASGEFEAVAVIGVPDPEWGEAVVACHPDGGKPPDAARVSAALEVLAAYKRPKRYVAVADWPEGPTGKILWNELRARASVTRKS